MCPSTIFSTMKIPKNAEKLNDLIKETGLDLIDCNNQNKKRSLDC